MTNSNQKDLIIALRSQGLSYRDIAEQIGVTEENARIICFRAKDKVIKTVKPEGVCKNCGQDLVYAEGKKKKQFCCDVCRATYHNAQIKHKAFICTCEQCGKQFVSFGNAKMRFCSPTCRMLARRKESFNA